MQKIQRNDCGWNVILRFKSDNWKNFTIYFFKLDERRYDHMFSLYIRATARTWAVYMISF